MGPDSEKHRELLPEEREAESDDPEGMTAVILDESEQRESDRVESGRSVEHRRSDSTDRP
jgi:hypothetical protein